MRQGQFMTTFIALGVVGLLSGCASNTPNYSANSPTSNSTSNLKSNPTNNSTNETTNNTDTKSSQSGTSGQETGTLGQQSGTTSATAGYSKGLQTVNYSSSELQKIRDLSEQQKISAYIPAKMGGPSGYYTPGAVTKTSNHTMSLQFEDMTFHEGPSWQAIQQSLTPKAGSLALVKGGSYTLSGGITGQWYTVNDSNGSRLDIFVFQKGTTWIGIVPNPAKSTLPSLIQAVAQTLKPV